MKPLYHCVKCGRLSTRLSSYTGFEGQLYCKVCIPASQQHSAQGE